MKRFKQLATEKFNNLDLDKLPVQKSRTEKILWPFVKKLFRKLFLALLPVLIDMLKDPELVSEINAQADKDHKGE